MSETKRINDGGPAFPVPLAFNPNSGEPQHTGMYFDGNGMSLRDWLASQESIHPEDELGSGLLEALAGPKPSGNWTTNPIEWFHWNNKWQAEVRYARADALLVAREGGAK